MVFATKRRPTNTRPRIIRSILTINTITESGTGIICVIVRANPVTPAAAKSCGRMIRPKAAAVKAVPISNSAADINFCIYMLVCKIISVPTFI